MIAGNHDITLHEEFYAGTGKSKHRRGGEDVKAVREMWTGEEARAAGVVYLEEGVGKWTLRSGVAFTVGAVWGFPFWKEWVDGVRRWLGILRRKRINRRAAL